MVFKEEKSMTRGSFKKSLSEKVILKKCGLFVGVVFHRGFHNIHTLTISDQDEKMLERFTFKTNSASIRTKTNKIFK